MSCQSGWSASKTYNAFPFSGLSSSATRGWIKLYAARFPDAPLTEALVARVEPSRRLANDIVGGWVTCYDSPV